jgi:hypothetical protein
MKIALSREDYGSDHYFAFVESTDEFDSEAKHGNDQWGNRIAALLQQRMEAGTKWPERLVWLDCVHAPYFASLPWRDDPCEVNNPDQATARRELIQAFDPSAFRVALLLTNLTFDEVPVDFGAPTGVLWHRVRLGKEGSLPVTTGADFDLEGDAQSLRFTYLGLCTEDERASLNNVFNFNFLPDANLGGTRGEPGGIPPPTLPLDPLGGKALAPELTVTVTTRTPGYTDLWERR